MHIYFRCRIHCTMGLQKKYALVSWIFQNTSYLQKDEKSTFVDFKWVFYCGKRNKELIRVRIQEFYVKSKYVSQKCQKTDIYGNSCSSHAWLNPLDLLFRALLIWFRLRNKLCQKVPLSKQVHLSSVFHLWRLFSDYS